MGKLQMILLRGWMEFNGEYGMMGLMRFDGNSSRLTPQSLEFPEIVAGFLDRDAFHLDEPCGSAHGRQGDDQRHVGELLVEHLLDGFVVGAVAQIDYNLHDVLVAHASFLEQLLHILPHTQGLLVDVAHMHHFALVVDRGCSRDVDVVAVAILHEGATLEGDTVFDGSVEVREGIEIALLLGLKAGHCIAAQLHKGLGVGRSAANAGRGDVVRVGSQSLLDEALSA